jgi:GntR family transcriptional regulator
MIMAGELDDMSGIPRYIQVARLIEHDIRAGVLVPGQTVPSVVALSQTYGIAKTTASRAHAYLADRNLVIAAPGVGMVVLPRARWAPAEDLARFRPVVVGARGFPAAEGRRDTAAAAGKTLPDRVPSCACSCSILLTGAFHCPPMC